METGQIVAGCIVGLVAVILGVYVSFTVRGKGPVLLNDYLWLSKEERENFDKKAAYKVISIVFGCLAAAFALLALHIFTSWEWPFQLMLVVCGIVIVYAITQWIWSETRKRKG